MRRLFPTALAWLGAAAVIPSGLAFNADETWIGSWQAAPDAQSLCIAFTGTKANPTADVSYGNSPRYETVAVRREDDDTVSFDLPDTGLTPMQFRLTVSKAAATGTVRHRDGANRIESKVDLKQFAFTIPGLHFGGKTPVMTLLHKEQAVSTPEARAARIQGAVRVKATILPNGSVGPDVEVLRGLGYGLDERAVEAVKKWKFSPPSPDCRPRNTAINIEISFR